MILSNAAEDSPVSDSKTKWKSDQDLWKHHRRTSSWALSGAVRSRL